MGQEDHKGSPMGTALATAKSKPLCVSSASPPGALHPAQVSAPGTTDPAPSTHPQYPAASHHCTLLQCLTQPQLCSPCPSPGSTVPSPAGTSGGLLPPPGKQQGTMMGAGEDKAKIALRWQEERVTSPGCPRETGLGGGQRRPHLHSPWCPCVLPPRDVVGRGSCHRGPRAILKHFAFVFLLQLQTFSSSHFLILCRFAGGGEDEGGSLLPGVALPRETPSLLQTAAAGARGH